MSNQRSKVDLPTLKILSKPHVIESVVTEDEQGWVRFGTLPSLIQSISNTIAIDDDHYLVATDINNPKIEHKYSGIWCYKVSDKCWRYVIKYNKSVFRKARNTTIVYNHDNFELRRR